MIILGDKHIEYDALYRVDNIDMIFKTPSNSVVLFDYDIDLMKYCMQNSVEYAVVVKNIKQTIYASNLDAKYIIASYDNAKILQNIAQNYMFDSKILAIIKNDEEIEKVALDSIDGAIYESIL